jgi:pantothenate kinase
LVPETLVPEPSVLVRPVPEPPVLVRPVPEPPVLVRPIGEPPVPERQMTPSVPEPSVPRCQPRPLTLPAGGYGAFVTTDPASPTGEPSTVAELVERARALAIPAERHILGIVGAPGAGKSTVAAQIVAALGPDLAVLVAMDGFHLANVVLASLGRRDRKGAHDTFDDAGYANLMERLHRSAPGRATPDNSEIVYAPEFRREIEEPIGSAVPVPAQTALVVTEGNYLLLDRDAWPRARACIDEVWFLAPGDKVRQDRLVRRHEAFGKSPDDARAWALGTDQRNAELIESTAGSADLVIRLT